MNFLTNWKTSLAGIIVIALGAMHQFIGINVPGFSMDFGTAVTAGLGLIFAQDATK